MVSLNPHQARHGVKRLTILAALAFLLGPVLVVPSSVPAQAFETDGLLIYFDFSNVPNTSLGTMLPDLSGNGRDGVISGSVPLSFDATNKALDFPGGANGTSFVDLAGDFANFGNGLTIEFEGHFGGTLSDWERVFDFGSSGGEEDTFWVGHMWDSGQIALEVWSNDVNQGRCYSSPNDFTITGINTYSGTRSLDTSRTFAKWVLTLGPKVEGGPSVCRIYKNGAEIPTQVRNAAYNDSTSRVADGSAYPLPRVQSRLDNYLGRSNWTADRDFEGSIRYIRVYNRVLDPSEVTTNNTTSFVVSFDPNSGTGSMAPQASSTATTLRSNTFQRDGYRFAGWTTESDGSGTPYSDGATFPFTASDTLFAQWVEDSVSTAPSSPATAIANNPTLAATGPSSFFVIGTTSAVLTGLGIGVAILRRRLLLRD